MSALPAILIALILITLLIVSISISMLLKDTKTGAEIDDMIAGIIKSMRRKNETN